MAKRFAKPIDQDLEDELEEDMEDEDGDYEEYEERSRVVPFLLLSVALLAFVGLGWYAYQAGSAPDSEDLMLVEAEQTPIKEKPLDAGGMLFPHQDKSVFETIAGGEAPAAGDAQVINSSEEPMQAAPAPVATTDAAQPATPQEAAPVAQESSAATIAATEPAAAAPAPQEIKEVPVASVKEVTPAEAKPAPKAKAAPVTSGNQTVQLGAFKSETEANAAWKKISGNAALSGKSPNIIMADLGDKGIFYRLRVSGVNAKATCASLAGKSLCMAVK